ncbi:hypothetical protein L1277_002350 [Okibacterium sp. HSC-33S16]|uniref:hypothetical protein n=1 Tax=Okibacterium sp. HSC-33S16 TaxID=2910965 RepID=UPI0020A0912F|nr:hypothetical protein [Okibacterium sp. HSC-33S16]MCP2032251.1 hypothetical protein [Okibacterium sp. HSC-33S16]
MSVSDEALSMLHQIAAELEQDGPVEVGTMFRSPGIRTGTRIIAFLGADGRLIAKLPRERAVKIVDAGQADFVTMGGRTMREWIDIPSAADPGSTLAVWLPLAREALAYARQSVES